MYDVDALATIVVDEGLRLHRDLGPGLLESVYEVLLAAKLERRGLVVERQKPIDIIYDDVSLSAAFRADLLVNSRLLIEIKSIDRLAPVHAKQVITYLRLMKLPLGLLINFGGETFKEGIRRIVNNHQNLAP